MPNDDKLTIAPGTNSECNRHECQWEPRVDRGSLSPEAQVAIIENVADGSLDDDELDAIIGRLAPMSYVRDICVTCGATRDRRPA